MDVKQVIAWLVPILARGIAWILAAKLGIEAAEAQDLPAQDWAKSLKFHVMPPEKRKRQQTAGLATVAM